MKTKFALTLIGLLISLNVVQAASAEIYIEPFLGYGSGRWEQGSNNQKFKGPAYGLRLGYYVLGFSTGLEYQGGKFTDNSSPSNLDIKTTDLGLYAGFEFPILLRVYGSYFPKSKMDASGGTTSKSYDGHGLKLGVGFTTLPFLAINFEYQVNTFEEDTSQVVATKELKTTAIGVNVSFPLEL